jgi:3-phenylpropionate/trans-cinnamate dioxygenase ferredoxin reductase subunit
MLAVGVVEILAGLVVALRPGIGGYLVAAWLFGIIVNLVTMGEYLSPVRHPAGGSLLTRRVPLTDPWPQGVVMAKTPTFVIVGGGLAAAKTAEGLRDHGYEGRIMLIGAEQHLPYERPPLSKGYLVGSDELAGAFVHTADWYDDHQVELLLGTPVTAVDLASHTVLRDDRRVHFDKLLIATGASPRRLPAADASGAPVAYLRTIEDSERIKAVLRPGHRIAIIGGGWIGLEVAAAARLAGCDVVVIEALERPLLRALGPEVAEMFAGLHQAHGVELRTSASVSSVRGAAGRAVVRLGDGTGIEADLLVVGVGVIPDVALDNAAGLKTGNGIVVDEYLRTSDPDVFAAGDVANAYHPRLGRHVRVEHWDNAIAQGLTAARNMLGAQESYLRLPYFFTDQYDLGMEYVGNIGPDGYDQVVVRGDVPGRLFTTFWLNGGAVVAGMHVNDWDAIEAIRHIVWIGGVDVAALRDADVPLNDIPACSDSSGV